MNFFQLKVVEQDLPIMPNNVSPKIFATYYKNGKPATQADANGNIAYFYPDKFDGSETRYDESYTVNIKYSE